MKMKLVFPLFLLSVFVGCRDNRVTGGVEHELDVLLPKIGVEYTPPLWKNLFDKVSACTNAADRKAASQSPEMRAIWRGQVGPMKFARDTDPPVEFPPFEVPVCETNAAAPEVEVDI